MNRNDTSNEIMVSVVCTTYNHEKYIGKCLDGFLMQKTNFKYEVIVHDDASTDKTADIIREYAEKYPDVIHPILQTENQYSKRVPIAKEYVLPKIRGKYVAFCEGDDYWSDENKLQLQFDAMEAHPECSFCTHYVKAIDSASGEVNGFFPNRAWNLREGLVEKELQADVLLNEFFQLTSYFIRKKEYEDFLNATLSYRQYMTGDTAMLSYLSTHGRFCFVDREMSVYRYGSEGSWTSRTYSQTEAKINHYRSEIQGFALLRDEYLDDSVKKYAEKRIIHDEWLILDCEKNYRKQRDKRYRDCLKKEPLKKKLIVFIGSIFPGLMKWYHKIKK